MKCHIRQPSSIQLTLKKLMYFVCNLRRGIGGSNLNLTWKRRCILIHQREERCGTNFTKSHSGIQIIDVGSGRQFHYQTMIEFKNFLLSETRQTIGLVTRRHISCQRQLMPISDLIAWQQIDLSLIRPRLTGSCEVEANLNVFLTRPRSKIDPRLSIYTVVKKLLNESLCKHVGVTTTPHWIIFHRSIRRRTTLGRSTTATLPNTPRWIVDHIIGGNQTPNTVITGDRNAQRICRVVW